MKKPKIPLFPEEVIKISRNKFLTKKQLREYILNHHADLAERYCISKTFNQKTGEIEKKYAWHSIIEIMNKEGHSETMIKTMLWI